MNLVFRSLFLFLLLFPVAGKAITISPDTTVMGLSLVWEMNRAEALLRWQLSCTPTCLEEEQGTFQTWFHARENVPFQLKFEKDQLTLSMPDRRGRDFLDVFTTSFSFLFNALDFDDPQGLISNPSLEAFTFEQYVVPEPDPLVFTSLLGAGNLTVRLNESVNIRFSKPVQVTPEPGTWALLFGGLLGLAYTGRR